MEHKFLDFIIPFLLYNLHRHRETWIPAPSRGRFVKIEFVGSSKCYGVELVLSGQSNFLKIDTKNIKSWSKMHNGDKTMEYLLPLLS